MASILAFFRRLLRMFGLGGHAPVADATPAPSPPSPAMPGLGAGRPAPDPVTLAMPQLVATDGQFPTRGDGGTNAYFTLGMIQTFAGFTSAYGAPRAEGQELEIPTNQPLCAVFGMTFGGEPPMKFALPNLIGRVAVGGQQMGMIQPGRLTLNWLISTGASSQAPLPGMLAMFGAGYAPDGWAVCDGSLLPIPQNVTLFEAIGFAFGGNQASVFALPNLLNGSAPVGAGQGPGRAPVTVGEQVAGPIPGLGVNYLISTEAPYPPSSGTGAFPDTGQYLGQVIAYGGAQVPAGWALCDGSLQQISANEPLFQLIGTTYGGDGQSDFALPDLRGLMVTGMGG